MAVMTPWPVTMTSVANRKSSCRTCMHVVDIIE